jgi:hypothetical protein
MRYLSTSDSAFSATFSAVNPKLVSTSPARCRCTEAAHADDDAVLAHIAIPPHGDPRFNRHPGFYFRGKDLSFVVIGLLFEKIPTGHIDHPGRHSLLLEQFLRIQGLVDLCSTGQQKEIRRPVTIGDDVGASGQLTAGLLLGQNRQLLPAEEQRHRPSFMVRALRQATAVSVASAGRMTVRFGIMPAGWPVAPRADGWGRPRPRRHCRG